MGRALLLTGMYIYVFAHSASAVWAVLDGTGKQKKDCRGFFLKLSLLLADAIYIEESRMTSLVLLKELGDYPFGETTLPLMCQCLF